MFLPRRRHRRLLLPPGWVALGFLLLLGCWALLTHGRQLRPESVMQVTLPMLKPDTVGWAAYRRNKIPPFDFSYSGHQVMLRAKPARCWHDFDFIGVRSADSISGQKALAAIRTIQADTSHDGGVRIRFQPRVAYSNLVRVLDMMNKLNHKKFWLDTQQRPTTFYAITNKVLPASATRINVSNDCMLCNDVFIEEPPGPTFQQLFFKKLALLQQQAWRPSILLFAAISSLSIYRLGRLRRAAR